jgi:ATP-dependent Clp protease ATP-binding subunit ClpB
MAEIVSIQLARTADEIRQNRGIELTFSESAKNELAASGYDPAFGARPLKRLIQNKILDQLALKIIDGSVGEGSKILVDFNKNEFILN